MSHAQNAGCRTAAEFRGAATLRAGDERSRSLCVFGGTTREAIEMAERPGDADTADLFTEISRGLDKSLWFLEAHLQSSDDPSVKE